MISAASLIKRIATVPARLFIESLPLLQESDTTALVSAVQADRADLVKILVLYEAQHIPRAIEYSQSRDMHQFLTLCLEPGSEEYIYVNEAAWFRAARNGDAGFIRNMLALYIGSRNPDFDPEHKNKTALHEAVCNNQIDLLPLLSEEQRLPWRNGKTALMMAAEAGNERICRFLQNELGCEDQYGWNALMYAVDGRHIGCIQWLYKEAKERNEFKMNAIDIARKRGMTDVEQVLLQVQETIE